MAAGGLLEIGGTQVAFIDLVLVVWFGLVALSTAYVAYDAFTRNPDEMTVCIHPMHIYGGPFTIVETDGEPVPKSARIRKDTVNVGPGECYDVIWQARRPGRWLLHCHIPHHTTNDNVEEQGAGALTTIIDVRSRASHQPIRRAGTFA